MNTEEVRDTDDLSWFSWTNVLFSIFVTVTIYSLPIAIWRYAIFRKPVDRKKAKWITIIYGTVAFGVMAILLFFSGGNTPGGAILLWSYVNYRILIGGNYAREEQPEKTDKGIGSEDKAADEQISKPQVLAQRSDEVEPCDAIRYCHKCGGRLLAGSVFCSYCGTSLTHGREVVRPVMETGRNTGGGEKNKKKRSRVILIILLVLCTIISLAGNVVQYSWGQQDKETIILKEAEITTLNGVIAERDKRIEELEMDMLIQSKVVETMKGMISDLEEDIKDTNVLLEAYREKFGFLYIK